MFVHHLVLKKKKKKIQKPKFSSPKEKPCSEITRIFSKTIFAQGDVHISFGGKFHGKPF